MSTIPLLFWLIQDPFDDFLIGAIKFAHAFSDTGTTERTERLMLTSLMLFLTTYRSMFEVHSKSLEILIHPLRSCIHAWPYFDREELA